MKKKSKYKYKFKANSKKTFHEDYKCFVGESLLLGFFRNPKAALAVKLVCDEAMRKAGRTPNILDNSPIMAALDREEENEEIDLREEFDKEYNAYLDSKRRNRYAK